MKRIALLAVIGGSLLALPSTAASQAGAAACPVSPTVNVDNPGQVCVNVGGLGGELIINETPRNCSYINGWSAMPSNGAGYAGLCTGAVSRGPTCTPTGTAGTRNDGGCLQVDGNPGGVNAVLNDGIQSAVTAMIICGATEGEDPNNTHTDGCSNPNLID